MSAGREPITAPQLMTDRLALEPLRVDHAEEMAEALDDAALHTFIGGHPSDAPELRRLYTAQVAGVSADGTEWWLNWVLRRRDTLRAIGYVQATITGFPGDLAAEVAWVVGVPDQGLGYAVEAASEMARWLRDRGVAVILAHVHPDHAASAAVAHRLGLAPTTVVQDGEVRWLG